MMRTLVVGIFCGLIGLGLTTMTRAADKEAPKVEEGFTSLFTGKDLSGWNLKKDNSSLEGKADAADKRFTVKDGLMVVDPKVKGDVTIQTAKEFSKNVHVKIEYRPGEKCNNDIYFRGLKFDLKKEDVKNLKDGEWNEFEIIVNGDMAELKNNGEAIKSVKVMPAGTLGLRAEIGTIEFRRVRFKQLP